MFKNEIKKEFRDINYSNNTIDSELIKIKVALHTLEKLGVDTTELYKQVDNVGIEFYKLKNDILEKFKQQI